jgi:hypothetical protein
MAERFGNIVNFNPDKAVSDTLYKKLGQLDYINRFGETVGPLAFMASKLITDVGMPISQVQSNMSAANPWGDATKARLEQYAVADVMKPLESNEPITLREFITQAGIDKDTTEIIAKEIPKMLMTEAKSNDEFAKFFRMSGGTYEMLDTGDFGLLLKNLEKNNPALFNSVIAGFAKMKTEYDNQELYGENAAKQVGSIFDFRKESAPTAAAISAIRGDSPNITSLSIAVQRAMADNMDMKKLVNAENREKAKENLKKIDQIFGTVYGNMPITK